MSKLGDLDRYMFEGDGFNVVLLTGTAVPTRTDIPKGCFCVIDYKDNAADHDVYIYGDGAVADTYAWQLVHNET